MTLDITTHVDAVEAAAILGPGWSVPQVRELCKMSALDAHKIRNEWVVSRDSVEALARHLAN